MHGAKELQQLAAVNWSKTGFSVALDGSNGSKLLALVAQIYDDYMRETDQSEPFQANLKVLQSSHCLETLLWPLWLQHHAVSNDLQASKPLVACIVLLVNACNSNVKRWQAFASDQKKSISGFQSLVLQLVQLLINQEDQPRWDIAETMQALQFLQHGFHSIEIPFIAKTCLRLVSLPMWSCLSEKQRKLEFQAIPKLEKRWNALQKAHSKSANNVDQPPPKKRKTRHQKNQKDDQGSMSDEQHAVWKYLESSFVQRLLDQFMDLLDSDLGPQSAKFLAVFVTFWTDLLSQLPTRRFLLAILRRKHFLARVRSCRLLQQLLDTSPESVCFARQLELLEYFMVFAMDPKSGKALTWKESELLQAKKVEEMQKLVFEQFQNTKLEQLALAPTGLILNKPRFHELLDQVVSSSRWQLIQLACDLGVLREEEASEEVISNSMLVECFCEEFSMVKPFSTSGSEATTSPNEHSVFPTEMELWNEPWCGQDTFSSVGLTPAMPIPKMTLQFLSWTDFLTRNRQLLQMEFWHLIRQDIERALKGVQSVRSLDGSTKFRRGTLSSKRAYPLLETPKIVQVNKPRLGETAPNGVFAHVLVDVRRNQGNKHNKDEAPKDEGIENDFDDGSEDPLAPHEVVYLVEVRATQDEAMDYINAKESDGTDQKNEDSTSQSFPQQYGVMAMRAAKIVDVSDGSNNNSDKRKTKLPLRGTRRLLKLQFDGVLYQTDLMQQNLEVYSQLNLLVRCNATNNQRFVTMLQTVDQGISQTELMDQQSIPWMIPNWSSDLYLGYGDPSAADYKTIAKEHNTMALETHLYDTFENADHAVASLKTFGEVEVVNALDGKALAIKDACEPFTLVENLNTNTLVLKAQLKQSACTDRETLKRPTNTRFTAAQVAATIQAMKPGLTLIDGAPKSGKTEVALQVVAKLHRTRVGQKTDRILVVSSSDDGVKDFLTRLVHNEQITLSDVVHMKSTNKRQDSNESTGHDFSHSAQVDWLLQHRLDMLKQAESIAAAMEEANERAKGWAGSCGYSCENALLFYETHLKDLLKTALASASKGSNADIQVVEQLFRHVNKAPEKENKASQLTDHQLNAFVADMEKLFAEIRRLQVLELLPTRHQRTEMYLVQYAKVFVMTIQEVGVYHRRLAELGISFNSLIMDDAHAMTEIESLMAWMLLKGGNTSGNHPESRRVVLLGDASAKVPTVNHPALGPYSAFDQSTFTRLVRLGVKPVVLDALKE